MSASRIAAAVALVTVVAAGVAFVNKVNGDSTVQPETGALGAADLLGDSSLRLQGVKAGGNPAVVSAKAQDSLWGSAVDPERRSLMGYYYYSTPTPTPAPAPEYEGGPWFVYDKPKNDLPNNNYLINMVFDDATLTYTTCQTAQDNYPENTIGELQDISSGEYGQVFGPFDISGGKLGRIKFGGEKYYAFWVSTNGYISFEEPTFDKTVSKNAFWSVPMAAPLFTSLNPSAFGNTKLKVKVTRNRVIITWNNFGQKGKEDNKRRRVSMQFVMNKKGEMQFYYEKLKIHAASIVGLSAGLGRTFPPVGKLDFTTASTC